MLRCRERRGTCCNASARENVRGVGMMQEARKESVEEMLEVSRFRVIWSDLEVVRGESRMGVRRWQGAWD